MLFFFNDTATTEIYTLSLHDALPISPPAVQLRRAGPAHAGPHADPGDRKSTRLNSSHTVISYAVFCLKKQKTISHAMLTSDCQVGCCATYRCFGAEAYLLYTTTSIGV